MIIAIYYYSGLKFVVNKFYPSKSSGSLPTGPIWLISLYVALFGIAQSRYENRAAEINSLVNINESQLATERWYFALSRIPHIQWQACPIKPSIFNPKSVILSIFGKETQNEEIADYLKNVITDYKDKLINANLQYCDLRGTIFLSGNFDKANLIYTKLDQAIFQLVNFKDANFFNSRFNNALFQECDFKNADLLNVNMEGASFWKCNLDEAKGLTLKQLLKCKSLYQCKLKAEWKQIIEKDYSSLLEIQQKLGYQKDFKYLLSHTMPKSFQQIFKEHQADEPLAKSCWAYNMLWS